LLSQVHPLLHFDATSASLPSGYCFPTGVNCRQQPPSKSTSLELLDPSAFTDPGALLSHLRIRRRLNSFALPFRSPILRVWLPSRWTQRPEPLKASFSSQRSWASPFRAFLLSSDHVAVSSNPLRSCTFLPNLPAWYRCSSGFLPPEKPCPSRASRRISSGRDLLLS